MAHDQPSAVALPGMRDKADRCVLRLTDAPPTHFATLDIDVR